MIVVIDHFDSFVETLARYVREAGHKSLVMRQNVSVNDVLRENPLGVILSPGPGGPENTGVTLDLLAALPPHVPVLGICLGHQTLAHYLGGRVSRAQEPRHGKPSPLSHEGHFLFNGIPSPFEAGRYHALIVDALPDACRVISQSAAGENMGFAHETRPLYGLQFHPESILTPWGRCMIENFLNSLPDAGAKGKKKVAA
jgi:anthranilate synthase/aminodeoxychorismate synthase-like glutamine amidotransferase